MRVSSSNSSKRLPLAIVLKGYPRLSETFIAQEIRSLEEHGFEITLYSLRLPTDKKTHPVHEEIQARRVYLPEYLYQQPLRVIRSLWKIRRRIGGAQVFSTWWNDFRRDPSFNRIRRLGQAFVLAAELPDHITRVYVHFLHTPASVTRYACLILRLPWACSAHAKDIWTSPPWELKEKLNECKWLTTCTSANAEYLEGLADDSSKVKLNYHGLDLSRFHCKQPTFSDRDGSQESQPVVILSVGRAVAKKGYHSLLNSLALLPAEVHWKFVHIGGGPLRADLESTAELLGIEHHIQWFGPQSQQTVLQHYQQSDLFVLNCQIDENGDRDGLPNVLVEAQSQGLAVISTDISGIPELIRPGENGILVHPDDTADLTRSLAHLITHPEVRARMGHSGHQIVQTTFDMKNNHNELYQLLEDL